MTRDQVGKTAHKNARPFKKKQSPWLCRILPKTFDRVVRPEANDRTKRNERPHSTSTKVKKRSANARLRKPALIEKFSAVRPEEGDQKEVLKDVLAQISRNLELTSAKHEPRDLFKKPFGDPSGGSPHVDLAWRWNSGKELRSLAQEMDIADSNALGFAQIRCRTRRRGRIGICDSGLRLAAPLKEALWQLRRALEMGPPQRGQRFDRNPTPALFF